MGYETYIARRYLRSGRLFTSVSTWITVAGVTLGVAVVCFVMAMHNGFEREIRDRLLGTTSHISVFPLTGGLIKEYRDLVSNVEQVDGVLAASPFIYYKAAISSASAGDGIIVRGINPVLERHTANVASTITAGAYSFDPIIEDDDTIPGLIMGSGLAQRLGVFVGDPVVLYSLRGEDLHKRSRPRVAKFHVSGLFETGMYEFDAQLAYISLAAAQDLFRTGDAVTAVHLKLNNIYRAEHLAPIIDERLGYRYDVVPWNVLHRNLFSWITLEKYALFLGFMLIVLVAAFSIISTMIMLTMEKREEIGILKTIGSTPNSILRIFLYKGLVIGAVGTFLGWGLAVLCGYLQNRYEIVSLPAEIYFISYLPIESHVLDYLVVGAVTFVVCLVAALFPALQAARVSVIDVLRR